jgi:hypothetical protein
MRQTIHFTDRPNGNSYTHHQDARAIVLTSEQWFSLSGTENTDGGLIINLNEMQKNIRSLSIQGN